MTIVDFTLNVHRDAPSELDDLLDEAARRAYRRQTKSRKQIGVWHWNSDGWSSDGSYSLFRATITGKRSSSGYPVIAEAHARVNWIEFNQEAE